VLDDAFQHRRLKRLEDVVLVAADRFAEPARPMPAGPWREPFGALRRSSLLVVTRKTASFEAATSLASLLAPSTRTGAVAVAALTLDSLHAVFVPGTKPLSSLSGARVLAVAGIADAETFAAQLGETGARVELMSFGDHHRYSSRDVQRIAAAAHAADVFVCTLKDAVKLRRLWPRAAPTPWYVSQRCEFEAGDAAVEAVLQRLLAARQANVREPAG
jgi:tetraacyldisaccharide 4'-kinase